MGQIKKNLKFRFCRPILENFRISLLRCSLILDIVVTPQISFSSFQGSYFEGSSVNISFTVSGKFQGSYHEGSSVNISCTASGTPDPDVKWIRNGEVKNSGKNAAFLTFRRINRADDGQYTCRANNSAGNDENHVTLVVYCK